MILPVLKNFTVTKGVTFDYGWQWLAGIPGSNAPQPLNGYTGRMSITDWNASVTYQTLVTGNTQPASGIYFGFSGDPSDGVINILISATDTAAFTFTTARYNFSVTAEDGITVTRLLYGTVVVDGSLP
jgi:hypothetical protein